MKYVKDNIIKTIDQVRQELPNISMREGADLTEFGFQTLIETPMPIRDGYHYIEGVTGVTQTWTEVQNEVVIPQSLTPRQIRKVLTDSGMRQAVEDMVKNSTDFDLKDWWEYSLDYERTHPKLIEAAYTLGLTDAQIDTMFIMGASL
ncbi:hypothetical protein [Sulfuricurvum sp.]|uniref:hypothetical protein n=1 Tax=Sulfuricurvum sp. TaxID=2025608 RepID=UPI002624E178|nr:hypothetical protein [Sulfuricurvum sp.]MDD2267650.1 hypothetical protein [Sulfuricurvum sp.]MDD2784764.1 hypothetical protein [Sulfuricurvum sp.]